VTVDVRALLDRRLLVFTGKGGVGKTTIASATALVAAELGRRVLLVEADGKGDVPAQFEHPPVGFAPVEVHPGVRAMAMDTEASLQEYIRLQLRVPVIGRIGPFARALDFVATAAPGVKEILTIGKIAWEVREAIAGRAEHDLVIVDAAATGHIVAQLGAADALHDLVDVGPLRSQTRWVSELVTDPAVTAVNVVTTPEEMPVAETIELVERLRTEVRAPLGTIVANRVLPEPFTRADAAVFAALVAGPGRAALTARIGAGAGDAVDAARLAVAMRSATTTHLDHLRTAVDLPVCYVPYLFVRAPGLRATRMVADAMAEEMGVR